jgi:hypothetical protein
MVTVIGWFPGGWSRGFAGAEEDEDGGDVGEKDDGEGWPESMSPARLALEPDEGVSW